MKTVTFEEFEDLIHYGDCTAFFYDDGTQKMHETEDIDEDSVQDFYEAEKIELYNMNELPEIKSLMRDDILSEFEPAEGVSDDGYDSMMSDFEKNNGFIAAAKKANNETTYMLIFNY